MASTNIRIRKERHAALQELARAVEDYRRRRLLKDLNQAYAALKPDPVEWREEQAERALWEGSLADDIEKE